MMLQLDHERHLKLDAFERVEDLQRQVLTLFLNVQILPTGLQKFLSASAFTQLTFYYF